MSLTAADEPDRRHLLPLLEKFPRVTSLPDRPLERPCVAIADKGYDSGRLRQEPVSRDVVTWIPRPGKPRTYPLGRVRRPA